MSNEDKNAKDIYTFEFHRKCFTKINGRLKRQYFLDDGTPKPPDQFNDPAMRKVATCINNGWIALGRPVEKQKKYENE